MRGVDIVRTGTGSVTRAALLLIDLQNDYLRSSFLRPSAGELVAQSARALAFCRSRGIPVAHCRTRVSPDHDERMPHWRRTGRWDCLAESEGYLPPVDLAAVEGEVVFHKTFFSPFGDGALQDWLIHNSVTTVLVAGVHLHACVRAAVLDAYAMGQEVVVIDDATGSDDPLHAAITRRYLESRAARFVTVGELPDLLSDGPSHSVHELSGRDLGRTTLAARRAADSWGHSSWEQRCELLSQMAIAIEKNQEALARCMTEELGKPLTAARGEVSRVRAALASVLSHVERSLAPSVDSHARFLARGVVAAITPWNNPVAIPLGKIFPALAYGNAVIWKPSPKAMMTSRLLVSILSENGVPEGLLMMIEGGREAAELLMGEEDVDAVTVTGSEATGRSAQDYCGRRMLPLQAELGGNNAAIVWDDCDLQRAATETAAGAFGFPGPRCTANRRIIVSERVRDELLDAFLRATALLPWGDPFDERTVVGPVVSHESRERLENLLARSAPFVTSVHRPHASTPAGTAPYVAPTIVCCDESGSEIVQEESFGPIAVVQTARNWEHALALCNGVRQGLAAALFSESSARQKQFLDRVKAGILKIGRTTADADVDAPFGGWKCSGIGPPEHGLSDREFYTRTQAVYGRR